jgi:hypothetical protein
MPTHAPNTEKRLLGTWRSDGPRTVREWRFRPAISRKKRDKFLTIFGKLTVTYTPRLRLWVMDDYRNRHRYEVLACDSRSVAIRYECPTSGEWLIEHIVFDGSRRYWIPLGNNREWFRRVKRAA